MTKKSWKRLVELTIAILSVIASFLGGQAAAQNGLVDLFNTQKVERSV